MSPGDALLVGASGLLAGGVNAVAGGGTLVSFPALLAVGLPPVVANVTSSVGLLSGYAGGSLAYRRELADQGHRVRALLPFAVIGAVAGAVLLLITPEDAFRALVPYLVLTSCALLAVQPRLARQLAVRRAGTPGVPWTARVAVGVGAVYGSYFGAGLGVLLLAVLGILVADELQRLNALKGVLSLLVNVVGVVVFVVSARVAWSYAALLAVTAFAGGTLGVSVARRLPNAVMRAAVIALGTVVGVVLLVS
ncbi:MAG: sulfite exporter TauE/SafE family protein [Actinobacteria bacterium]|nr:sulfite exporter TauE/SafE family protein [Actinomycetota bacterium]